MLALLDILRLPPAQKQTTQLAEVAQLLPLVAGQITEEEMPIALALRLCDLLDASLEPQDLLLRVARTFFLGLGNANAAIWLLTFGSCEEAQGTSHGM